MPSDTRFGLLVAPFAVLLALTGIGMNHKGPKFLKHLHTGKYLGDYGVWVVDLAAVLLLLLVCSGVSIYVLRP